MKFTHYLAVSLAVIGSLVGCKTNPSIDPVDPTPPVQETGTGTVTEVGQPTGAPISKTIGPEGGRIATADAKVQLVIPAGAVSQATTITVQPITNHAPNGFGPAYRFSPDGLKFKKPATLTFDYSDEMASATDADLMKIAYQGTDKIWYNMPGVQVDPQMKRISVSMPHFSDWSAYEIAYLESILLNAHHRTQTEFLGFGEELSLFINETVIAESEAVQQVAEEKFGGIKDVKWSLVGPGKLEKMPSAKGINYVAPKTGTAGLQVTVNAQITFQKSPKTLIFVQNIVVGQSYIELVFNGQTRIYTNVSLGTVTGEVWEINAGDREEDYLTLSVLGNSTGTFPFGNPLKTQTGICSGYYNQGKYAYRTHYACVGDIEKGIQIMNGSVKVAEFVTGKVVRGTFSGSLMKDDPEKDCPNESVPIRGTFYLTPEK